MKELTWSRIFNKLLFHAAAVEYIVLTNWPSNVKFREEGSCAHPRNDHDRMWHTEAGLWCTLTCQISSGWILSPLKGEKPQILPHFQLWHPLVASPSCIETNLPLSNNIKTLLSSKAFWVSCSHKLCYPRAWRTDKQKLNIFGPPAACDVRAPTELGTVIEDLKHVLEPRNVWGVWQFHR